VVVACIGDASLPPPDQGTCAKFQGAFERIHPRPVLSWRAESSRDAETALANATEEFFVDSSRGDVKIRSGDPFSISTPLSR
jgi:hypothetical protein